MMQYPLMLQTSSGRQSLGKFQRKGNYTLFAHPTPGLRMAWTEEESKMDNLFLFTILISSET